jgi:pyruvate,orthophosphate dikinase
MILARDEKNRRKACSRPWTGFPVMIRTLDPPLHEILPKREQPMVDLANLPAASLKAK